MSDLRRMPDGTMTQNVDEYVNAWTELGATVMRLLPGYVLDKFDPGMHFTKWEKKADGTSYAIADFSLPVVTVTELKKSVENIQISVAILNTAVETLCSDTRFEALGALAKTALQNLRVHVGKE